MLNTTEPPGTGPDRPSGGTGTCAVAEENNAVGCWWDWTRQAFVGPNCEYASMAECSCVHLTGFQAAKQSQLGSMPEPKWNTVSVAAMTSLSASDVLASGPLLTVLFGMYG